MKLESKVDKFPGYVELPEYLNLLQVRKIEEVFDGTTDIEPNSNGTIWLGVVNEKRLPAVLFIVKEWHIEGVPENPTLETFPMSPIQPANELTLQIFQEIIQIYAGEQVPND